MENLVSFVENRIAPPLIKIAENRILMALRDAFVSIMPIVAIGSLFLLAAFAPIPAWQNIVAPFADKIVMGFTMTFGILALYLSFSLGYSLAPVYELTPLPQGLMSAMVFLLLAAPAQDNGLPTGFMGGTGIFVAVVGAFFVVLVSSFFKRRGLVLEMPAGVPPVIASAFEVLFSLAAILVIVWFIRIWLGFDVAQFIQNLFKPLLIASDTLPAVIVESLLVTLLWFVGIHGHSIASWNVGILSGFALANLQANAGAFAAGQAIPHVVTPAFRSFFQIGVTTTIPICLILMFSKSRHLRQVGRLSILPGIFDVTEPLWFGMPIILNPFFLIPFILVDVLGLSLTYIIMAIGIVPKVVAEVHWAMPGPIGAFLATGGSWIAVIWYLILVALGTLIFYPFIVAYDRHLTREEAVEDEEEVAPSTEQAVSGAAD